MSDQSDKSDLSDKLVRPCIPRGFAYRCVEWLGCKVVAGVMQRADLPQGNALLA